MSDGDGESSTSFHRQRRDLFVISAILLIVQLADVKATKLGFLGLELEVGKSAVIYGALWVLWAYWYLRYFQVSLVEHAPREAYVRFNGRFRAILDAELSERAKVQVRLRISNDPDHKDSTSADVSRKHVDIGWLGATATYEPSVVRPSATRRTPLEPVTSQVGVVRLYAFGLRALTWAVLKDITFTEYLLPFVFGALPAVVFLVKRAI